ncbi:MAG: hypothetical protein M2R45_02075 [Verrucomicrobia subdivision 3 bacterium]|nr:hypothetical protein [Limisphaerales bacterium]MCS1413866.1 hypothetical protein [Limisphaerales bacterium]
MKITACTLSHSLTPLKRGVRRPNITPGSAQKDPRPTGVKRILSSAEGVIRCVIRRSSIRGENILDLSVQFEQVQHLGTDNLLLNFGNPVPLL